MRYRTIALLTVLLMMTFLIFTHTFRPKAQRYHQHREALPKAACTGHGPEVFCTHLPLLEITTDTPIPDPYIRDENGNIQKKENQLPVFNRETVAATLRLFDSPDRNNHLTDEPVLETRAQTRIRGNSSREFLKKNYLLKIKADNMVDDRDVSLAGMKADHSWALHGPFMDRTLIRNYMCYHLEGELMGYAPDVRFCEMFLNGEYMGVYLITEKVNFSRDGRVKMTPSDPELAETSYLLKLDKGAADDFHKLTTFCDYSGKRGLADRRQEHLEIVYPGDTLTPRQKAYIEAEISAFEKSLVSFDSPDNYRGYPAFLDQKSFADFLILSEFTMNSDSGVLSTFYSKDIRGKMKIIGWDYNNAFNNYYSDIASPQTFYMSNTWYSYLMRDKDFVQQVIRRYHHLRRTILSDKYLLNYIDETVAYLGPAAERNYEKWSMCFTEELDDLEPSAYPKHGMLYPLDRNAGSYEEAVEDLKSTIVARGEFMDKYIGVLQSRCHNSVNKQFNYQGARLP